MSSSSDIEKLFDHFGGDAGAYQEIGRENDARVARTRWPLLVTLDLTQPRIPAVTSVTSATASSSKHDAAALAGEPDASAQPAADAKQTHSSAQPGRARPPLFARAHRRDIPPVSAAQPAVPSGAARFGTAHEVAQGDAAREAQATSYANAAAAERSEAATAAAAATTPVAPGAHFTQAAQATQAVTAFDAPAAPHFAPIPPVVSASPLAPIASTSASAPLPATYAPLQPRVPSPVQPASNQQPASILGKLFTPAEPAPATSSQHVATPAAPAPLHAVFDRLRGNPVAGTPGAPADTARSAPLSPAAAPVAAPHSWLTNGPRRS